MSTGHFIAILALLVPIASIITKGLRDRAKADLEAARRDVELRRRFRLFDEIERRVADMERHVTSPEYQLNQQLGRLADKP